MYLFILWPFYLLLNLWAFMFCYIFSIQLKKPQSWHRMKKSHKVKKHKERFNCLLLIFFQLWDKSLIQAECLSWSPVGAEEMHTWNTSWNCFTAPGLSPQPSPNTFQAQRCQGWCLLPAHPTRISTGNRSRISPEPLCCLCCCHP